MKVLTFVTEDERGEGYLDIQWQFPHFTINCIAINDGFARKIIGFVAETRGHPDYRDIPLGEGVYRHMKEKSIDLSAHFLDVSLKVSKCGECDHGYLFRFSSRSDFWIDFHIQDQELDDFLDGLSAI